MLRRNENECKDGEYTALKTLASLEDLAEKKIKIFSRLLTDANLAKKMEELARKHEKRKNELLSLCGEKTEEGEEE